MRPISVIIAASFLFVAISFLSVESSLHSKRKQHPFYVLVRLPKNICYSKVAEPPRSGVCVNSRECRRINGTASGTCARGYGVCCLVTLNCSSNPEIVRVNGTHLVSPKDLMNQTSCEYRFPRPPGVCQIRLDFLQFETKPGDQLENGDYGGCYEDTLNIAGASNARFLGTLCGNLTGQHVHLDYGTSNMISLFNYIAAATNQTWDIQVTYLKCDSPELAPPGCLQYFTEPSGMVTSFNWPMLQLNNEDYTVCIKPLPGMNQIMWSKCGGLFGFFVSGIPLPMLPPGLPPPPPSPGTGDDCPNDWVMIFGVNKFCGNDFAGPVTTAARPFLLHVHFNEQEIPDLDDANTGFCLQYKQSP